MPLAFFGGGFGYYIDPLYLMIFIPVMLVGMACSWWVKSSFAKWDQVPSGNGITGAETARRILEAQGIEGVPVEEVPGDLSDHYDPSKRVVHLSSKVFHGNSLAAVGVAAHEVGHAIQHARSYAPLMLRRVMAPAITMSNVVYVILFMIAGVMYYMRNLQGAYWFAVAGLACVSAVFLFAVVTLPVEFDASLRAMTQLRTLGILDEVELGGVRKVLTAAAMTYVAGAMAALATLAYYLIRFGPLLAGGGRRRD